MISIKEALTKKEKRQFVNFPLKLYKKNPYFVPCLYQDELNVINRKSPYESVCDSVFYLAYDGKKVVGRIQGIIQKKFNELHGEKRVRFTRFDSIDNQEVANALFQAVENWAKSKGMETFCGPLGYSDLEREGLLIEGFNEHQTFQEQYNYPYYQRLIENWGFVKEVDWVESQITFSHERDEKTHNLSELILKKFNLHVIDNSKFSKKELLETYGDDFFDVIHDSYSELYGTVPFSQEERQKLIQAFLPILDPKQIMFLADSENKITAVGITFSDISDAVRKSRGHLYPFSLLRLMHSLKDPTHIDLGLIAVTKPYRNSGVTAIFIDHMHKNFTSFKHLKYLETNLNLEYNVRIRNMWNHFNSRENKRRRSFVKKIAQ